MGALLRFAMYVSLFHVCIVIPCMYRYSMYALLLYAYIAAHVYRLASLDCPGGSVHASLLISCMHCYSCMRRYSVYASPFTCARVFHNRRESDSYVLQFF